MIFVLFIVLFLCHTLADYTWLSTKEMLAAKRFGSPFFPILLHGGVHGMLMGLATVFLGYDVVFAVAVFMFQTWIHAGIDVLKGKVNKAFAIVQTTVNVWHWVVFGFDQYLHTLTIILIVFVSTIWK